MTQALANTLTLSVAPGVPVRLLTAAPADTVLINNDPANAVWVSDQPGVIPGSGIYLAVGGTATWSKAGSPIYACVDTGVAKPVAITIGGTISAYQNPFGVGLAVAEQLLISGVPNVLTTTTIVTNDTLPGNQNKTYDVRGYASLVIIMSLALNGGRANYGLTAAFVPDTGANLFNNIAEYTLMGKPEVSNTAINARMPVLGPYLVVGCNSANVTDVATYTIIGTNRPVPDFSVDYNNNLGQRWDYVGAISLGATNNFIGNPIQPGRTSGDCELSVFIDDMQTAGIFTVAYGDGNGHEYFLPIFDTKDLVPFPGGGRIGRANVTLPRAEHFFYYNADIGAILNPTTIHLDLVKTGGI